MVMASLPSNKIVTMKVFTQIIEFPYLENHIVIQMNEIKIEYSVIWHFYLCKA